MSVVVEIARGEPASRFLGEFSDGLSRRSSGRTNPELMMKTVSLILNTSFWQCKQRGMKGGGLVSG